MSNLDFHPTVHVPDYTMFREHLLESPSTLWMTTPSLVYDKAFLLLNHG
jgi:hypothetical protein